jgi:integrase
MAIELPLTDDDASVLIPIRPLRSVDHDIITEWIAARAGEAPEEITDYIIYQHDGNIPPAKHWTEKTCETARIKVTSLARRSTVPLTQLGLTRDGSFTPDSLRAPIVAYAKDFEYRNRGRIADLLQKLGPEAARLKGPLIWRTKAWWYFVTYGKEFFNWCERRSLRPKGSNPFQGISRPTTTKIGQTFIVEQWFHRIMGSVMSPKECAMIMLLANGLRANEALHLKISDLSLTNRTVRVLGKGSKLRTVNLYDRAIQALDRYLTWRRMDTRPWLFPHRFRNVTDSPGHKKMPNYIVWNVANRVFDDPTVIERLTPHTFRHYFISDWLHRGGNPTACKLQVGHCSLAMLERYTHMDPSWVADEAKRMDPNLTPEARHALAIDLMSRVHPTNQLIQLTPREIAANELAVQREARQRDLDAKRIVRIAHRSELDAKRDERELKRLERKRAGLPWESARLPDDDAAFFLEDAEDLRRLRQTR